MSWFDATGFANLAKSALKEAQKTIDKALDIVEDENTSSTYVEKPPVALDPSNAEADIFFDNWGLKSGENTDHEVNKDNQPGSSKQHMNTSLWGSFTGSFFENPPETAGEKTNDVSPLAVQLRKSSLKDKAVSRSTKWEQGDLLKTLEDDSSDFGFSQSKLVVESEDGDTEARSRLSSCEADDGENQVESFDNPDVYVPLRRRDHSTSNSRFNRLSVISSESDKKSSESVEVLGYGSGFTTSPETPGSYSGTSSGFRVSMAASTPDSVEVIPDTPSSVEVLCELSISGRTSRTTSSPYLSPLDPLEPPITFSGMDTSENTSPDSVEVIPEEDDEDRSIADDSYASASESTATGTVTILEQPQFMQLVKSDTVDSIKSLKSPHHKVYFVETPTKIGLASMMDSCNEKLIHEEPVLTHGNRAALSLPLTLVDLPSDGMDKLKVSESSNDDSMISDKTLVAIDSSCEGTISSDETLGAALGDDSESPVNTQLKQSGSYYVKSLLAEAMGEDEMKLSKTERDHSPISSESRSDMVKVESEQTSGHTSGDEIETTTSSDIEIISSPNGCDSSSTQSARHSPAKLLQQATRGKLVLTGDRSDSPGPDLLGKVGAKVKGHQRVSSETSSGGSEDSNCSEVEKLMKRLSEISEILEVRESKLIDLSRINAELQEANIDLKSQLQLAMQSHVGSQDVAKISEEFTQRLSSLERKFQQAVRERETLRKQLEQSKSEVATRLTMSELETRLHEKDEIIEELRKEGGKLSKQELQHSNIIKKLRIKEKECDTTIKHQKDQLDELYQEVERLKRCLAAKEDVERTQIEAVHQLTARSKRHDKELSAVRTQLDDASLKLITLNTSLEAANKEVLESRLALANKDKDLKDATLSTELAVREELVAALDDARLTSQRGHDQLLSQIDELQNSLRSAQADHSSRESKVRQECTDLLRRLEAAEARNEELSQSVSVVTRPLLRQIESLQAAHSTQQLSWEKQERSLLQTNGEVEGRLSALLEQDRSSREECAAMRSRVSAIQSKLAASNLQITELQEQMDKLRSEYTYLRHTKEKEMKETLLQHQTVNDQLSEMKREVSILEQQLVVERAATEAEKRRTTQLQDQLREREATARRVSRGSPPVISPRSSPTLSFGRVSLSESFSSAVWPQFHDDAFESGSTSGRNVYDSLRSGNTTSLLEGLQSQLKLREGEVQQLQWEMSRRDSERNAFTAELSMLTAHVEDQEKRLEEAATLRSQYEDVQQRYDALLQMYGEKMEESQELRLDLEDIKEMYKVQIDQLLQKETLQDT